MDRHRAPAMTRDPICLGVYVDGVCAVGCNRQKVLAALGAVKATLDAAGLQCTVAGSFSNWAAATAWSLPRAKDILPATRLPK